MSGSKAGDCDHPANRPVQMNIKCSWAKCVYLVLSTVVKHLRTQRPNLVRCLFCLSLKPGVPNLWHLMPDDLRGSWCNNNRDTVWVNIMPLNHPETITPPLVRGKIVFHETSPWCQKGWGALPLAKTEFYIFKWLKKIIRRITLCDIRKLYEIQFQCPWIKFYWNAAMPVHSYIASGCFHTVVAELSSCDRNRMAQKA